MMKTYLIAAAALLASSIAAQAATITPSAGLDLSLNGTQDNDVQAFSEKTDVSVGAGEVTVDFLVGTNLSVGDSKLGINNFSSGPSLAAGNYDSYLLHFDRTTNGSVTNFTIDFGANIVGLILSNSGSAQLLNASDGIFGTAAAFDTAGSRRAERNDAFTLTSATSVSFDFFVGASYTDNVRILTEVAPIPLPATLPLLLAGFGGLAWARRRR